MGLENVRLRLASAEVAQVAEVLPGPASVCDAAGAEVAGVAEVFDGSAVDVRHTDDAEVAEVEKKPLRILSPTKTGTCEGRAEVAEVSYSFTHAQAHARARARGERRGRDTLQPAQPLHAPATANILRHCRCIDCRKFSKPGGEYVCSEYIGGTKGIWGTSKRECDPPPEAWHYCACYDGSQISRDVWVWPRSSRHVPPGSNISVGAEQPAEHAPVRQGGAISQTRQDGQDRIGTPPALVATDGVGNSREPSFCLLEART